MRNVQIIMTALLLWAVVMPGFAADPVVDRTTAGKEAAPAATPAQAPHIEFEVKEINLGKVVRGEMVEGAFTVRNTGSAVLEIVKVKPG